MTKIRNYSSAAAGFFVMLGIFEVVVLAWTQGGAIPTWGVNAMLACLAVGAAFFVIFIATACWMAITSPSQTHKPAPALANINPTALTHQMAQGNTRFVYVFFVVLVGLFVIPLVMWATGDPNLAMAIFQDLAFSVPAGCIMLWSFIKVLVSSNRLRQPAPGSEDSKLSISARLVSILGMLASSVIVIGICSGVYYQIKREPIYMPCYASAIAGIVVGWICVALLGKEVAAVVDSDFHNTVSESNDLAVCNRCGKRFPTIALRTVPSDSERTPKLYCPSCRLWLRICLFFLSGLASFGVIFAIVQDYERYGFVYSNKARMEQNVKQELLNSGVQAGVDPVVELAEQKEGHWVGTARFGQVLYDITVEPRKDGLWIERRRRLP